MSPLIKKDLLLVLCAYNSYNRTTGLFGLTKLKCMHTGANVMFTQGSLSKTADAFFNF